MKELVSIADLDPHAPRTKRDYFALSRQQGLPNRCPILPRCERWGATIKIGRQRGAGENHPDPELCDPITHLAGEISCIGGTNNFFAKGLCPEVALFDPSNSLPALGGYPTTSGQYDKYMDPPYQIVDTGHFSECAEYVRSCSIHASTENGPDGGVPKIKQCINIVHLSGALTVEGANMSGDTYNISGQAGVVGPSAHAHDMTFTQSQGGIDLSKLTDELGRLRRAMKEEAIGTREQDKEVGLVADAEEAAAKGDRVAALQSLKRTGKWVLRVAEKIGVSIVVESIKQAL